MAVKLTRDPETGEDTTQYGPDEIKQQYWTSTQAASLLGISQWQVNKLARKHHIGAGRGHNKFTRKDIEHLRKLRGIDVEGWPKVQVE